MRYYIAITPAKFMSEIERVSHVSFFNAAGLGELLR